MSERGQKQEQILILEPKNELHFKGPYHDIVTKHLKLSNPSNRRVCFKVKTTAPKRYCVRPNNGIIEPNGSQKISVMLQPLSLDNQTSVEMKSKHKFMVQTMFAPDGEINQETLWRDANPDLIMDSKLKCVFDSSLENEAPVSSSTDNVARSSTASATITSEGEEQPVPSMHSSSDLAASGDKDFSDENRVLKDEVTKLRQELLQVREEGLKQRVNAKPNLLLPKGIRQQEEKSNGNEQLINLLMNPQVLAIGIVLYIIGLIMGKLLF